MSHIRFLTIFSFAIAAFIIVSPTQAASVQKDIAFPHITIESTKAEYAPQKHSVSGTVSYSTKEAFTSYGLRLATTLINSDGVPVYQSIPSTVFTLEPHIPLNTPFSFDIPKVLSSGSYRVAASILTPTGEALASSQSTTNITIAQPTHSLVFGKDPIKIQNGSSESDPAKSSAASLKSDSKLNIMLPATTLANVTVIPEIQLYRSVHPDILPPYQILSGEKTTLGTTSTAVSIVLPTDAEGLFYGKVQLIDSSTNHLVVSNPLQFSYQVGSRPSTIEGLAVSSTKQYGPFTFVKGSASLNKGSGTIGTSLPVLFTLKDQQGKIVKTSQVPSHNYIRNSVPFSFFVFGSLHSNAYTISAGLGSTNSITGTLPNTSGTTALMVVLFLFACVVIAVIVLVSRKLQRPRLVVLAGAMLIVGLAQFSSAPKALAADDYGKTNTTFTPVGGTDLGSFPACGGPDGNNFSGNESCKIKISGALNFNYQYLENANGSYRNLNYHFDYFEYQVFINGVLTADPYDPDSQRLAFSSTGLNGDGNDLFSFTLTPHFTGNYQIKFVPHYYFYFNSCESFNVNCTQEWYLSDQATFTATVTANKPTLLLPTTLSIPTGSTTASLNYLSSGLSAFTLSDSSGAASYPKQVSIGAAGNLLPVTGTSLIPVTRTPTQNLTATGQSVSNEPDSSSAQQFADPILLRQGDYQEWTYRTFTGPLILPNLSDFLRSTGGVNDKQLVHQPIMYPGDQLDYANMSIRTIGAYTNPRGYLPTVYTNALYIPVKRYGSVAGAPDDKLTQHCTSVSGAGSGNGTTCTTIYQPILNPGDSYLPLSKSNITSTTKCASPFGGKSCYLFSTTEIYDATQIVLRNYQGKTRLLFPINTTNNSVTQSLTIISGTGGTSTSPTALLTGPSSPVSAGTPIALNLALTNFSGAQSSGISLLPISSTISSACGSLGAAGGPCSDIQTPTTDTTYTYTGWACDGLNNSGVCIVSNSIQVTVSATGSSSSALSYILVATPNTEDGSIPFTLDATPTGSIAATKILFQCFTGDTPHNPPVNGSTGESTYTCAAPVVTVTASADAQASGYADSKPTATVTVSSSSPLPTVSSTTTTRFCAGD